MPYTPFFRTRFFFIFILLVVVIGFALFVRIFSPFSDSDSSAAIYLSNPAITSETDSDGDGVADWLEDLTDSDSYNPDSFPYAIDTARAQNITVDELLYGSPGPVAEEVFRKYLLGEEDSITAADRQDFIDESSEHFIAQAEARPLPAVSLTHDDSVSPSAVLEDFLLGLQHFSRSKTSFESVILGAFAGERPSIVLAQTLRSDCSATLKAMPRSVPLVVYDSYFIVLQRITYLCAALDLSVTGNSNTDYFFSIRLTSSGRLFERPPSTVSNLSSLEALFIDHARFVIETLQVLQSYPEDL